MPRTIGEASTGVLSGRLDVLSASWSAVWELTFPSGPVCCSEAQTRQSLLRRRCVLCSTGFPPLTLEASPQGTSLASSPANLPRKAMRRAPLGGPAFANLRRKGPRRVREACDMELYLMEGLSISSVIMWLLGLPLSLILLLWVVGIGR